MHRRAASVFAAISTGAALLTGAAAPPGPAEAGKPVAGFAVVELFTSEGCSSCPPADTALNELGRDPANKGQPVYLLAFHVDYWDYLGWTDPFASVEATARQRAYGNAFKLRSIYTPQAVINGHEQFVGSDRGRLRAGIKSAMTPAASVTLTLEAIAGEQPRDIDVTVLRTNGPGGAADVLVAVTEDGLLSAPTRGENQGETFTHDHVVRAFAVQASRPNEDVTLRLRLPEGVRRERARVIAFVQGSGAGRVLGAATAALPISKP